MKNFGTIIDNFDVVTKQYLDNIIANLPPAPNNGKLTITVNGMAHTFTANQAGDTSFSITDSDTGATSVGVTGAGNAVTAASYDSGTRKLTLTKGTSFQEKLTAGSNITISGNTISATDTGATYVVVTGDGNAVTYGTYDAKTRLLTLTRGTSFLTSHQSIKKLNTNNTAAQAVNASEAINGSGTINLHKVAKTGNYNDLLNKPSFDNLTRIQKQDYAGNNGAIQYFKLATFPAYNSTNNFASFIITGRMGG